mmetsp:Transcript_3334/g.10184  ORF Transcript_3334/g.10184 Transcript_3334/m.10184 type:complete len:226 (+) Transcript_3334:1018-1695(+)
MLWKGFAPWYRNASIAFSKSRLACLRTPDLEVSVGAASTSSVSQGLEGSAGDSGNCQRLLPHKDWQSSAGNSGSEILWISAEVLSWAWPQRAPEGTNSTALAFRPRNPRAEADAEERSTNLGTYPCSGRSNSIASSPKSRLKPSCRTSGLYLVSRALITALLAKCATLRLRPCTCAGETKGILSLGYRSKRCLCIRSKKTSALRGSKKLMNAYPTLVLLRMSMGK